MGVDGKQRGAGADDVEEGMEVSAVLDQLVVVLVRTRNPLNVGAVARAMQNFGVRDLRLVTPFEMALHEARSAVGADAIMRDAREFASVADAVADCRAVVGTTAARRRELRQPVVELERAATPMQAALSQGRVALLFGSEKHGLTRDDLDHCHWLVRIRTTAEQPSMNLGQAAAVCLWELARERAADVVPESQPRAAAAELEQLAALLLETLDSARYTHPDTRAVTESQIRLMLRRLHVTEADTHLLMGMLRKLLWQLQSRDRSRE